MISDKELGFLIRNALPEKNYVTKKKVCGIHSVSTKGRYLVIAYVMIYVIVSCFSFNIWPVV